MDPENEQLMADRHAVASGGHEKEHEEKRVVDIHIGKRGPETSHKGNLIIEENNTHKQIMNLQVQPRHVNACLVRGE